MKNKIFRRIISCILSGILVVTLCSNVIADEKVNWEDVKNYYPFSKWAVDIGMKYDLIFMENNSRQTKRHEVASIIYNIVDSKKLSQGNINFNDVGQLDEKTKNIIEIVAASNILKGYEDGTFKPFNNVTRAEFVTILDRTDILKDKNTSNSMNFTDIKGHWAKDSITKIANLGIVNGKSESCFCPEDTITPQEILVILDRLVNMNKISRNELIEAMTTTFKCKTYTDKENFITEKIYGNYDEIQNKIIYTWPYTEYYDPVNGIELATCKDIQHAIYFSITTQTSIPTEADKEYWELYNKIFECICAAKGLDPTNEINADKTATIRDLIIAMKHITDFNDGVKYEDRAYFSDTSESLKFSNKDEFNREEIIALNSLTVWMDDRRHYIKNEDIYLPLEAPITKVMLNYFMLNFRTVSDWEFQTLRNRELQFETDPNKLPRNYYEYPYVIKGIPNYVYEQPVKYYGREGGNYNAKITFLRKYGEDSGFIADEVTTFYNTMLNVDYSKTDFYYFKNSLLNSSNGVSEEDIDKYIEYVKNNKIIIKGKAQAIPGTIVVYEPFAYIRVMLEFEVINANENKNLLFLDFKNLKQKDIIYPKSGYSFAIDVPIQGMIYESEGKLKYGYYMATEAVVYECLYYDNYDYIMK